MPDIKGFIFNIERFTLHDGPGIRTTVFLKGCPLQCAWCCNPESQSPFPELSYFQEKCNGCGKCLEICPQGTLQFAEPQKPIRVDFSLCDGCGQCVSVCIPQTLVMMGEERSAADIASEVMRDKPFYVHSGGGVTLSGGEPLAQSMFSAEILRICHQSGIHTAIQTCGYAEKEDIDRLSPWLDLVIYDLKLMADDEHQRWTGKSNRRILENLAYIDSLKVPIVIQIPLIPGVNDSEVNLSAIFELAKSLSSLQGVSLLEYHPLGSGKYARLGRVYEFDQLPEIDVNYLQEKFTWAAQFGVPLIKFNG